MKHAFDMLSKRVDMSFVDYSRISRSQSGIEAYLGRYISAFATALPGAFARKTMISPLDGCVVDMYILFKLEHSRQFYPSDLLKKLYVTLVSQYPEISWEQDSNTIMVPADGFTFKVQPAFLLDNGGYLVPSPWSNDWMNYDVLKCKKELLAYDGRQRGKLIPLIRLVKAWNRRTNNIFDGYYLELLVTDIMAKVKIESYQSGLRYFFERALAQVVFKKADPANTDLQVEGVYDLEDLVNAMLHFQSAYRIANTAMEYERQGDTMAACDHWSQLFPGVFPSPVDVAADMRKRVGGKVSETLRIA